MIICEIKICEPEDGRLLQSPNPSLTATDPCPMYHVLLVSQDRSYRSIGNADPVVGTGQNRDHDILENEKQCRVGCASERSRRNRRHGVGNSVRFGAVQRQQQGQIFRCGHNAHRFATGFRKCTVYSSMELESVLQVLRISRKKMELCANAAQQRQYKHMHTHCQGESSVQCYCGWWCVTP